MPELCGASFYTRNRAQEVLFALVSTNLHDMIQFLAERATINMNRRRNRASRAAAMFLIAAACRSNPARATDTWTNLGGTGQWNFGANWADGSVPTASDAAI